jgi:para-nitrobenzyl esterase
LQLRLAIAAALLAAATPLAAEDGAAPTVEVAGGEVAGAKAGSDLVFRGIPYAAPPLGNLRWRPPAPLTEWDGVRDVSQPAPACLQKSEGWNHASYLHASEDCLTLDIRTPSLAGKRPVMVWIHGGSNRSGSSGGPADSNMTGQGVVHVGVQYRLGLLGFMSHPGLSAEQGGASGNYALMDQIAALRWVRDNIARFGGDPANVTIYGESAGSQDVSLLLAAPEAQGLFHKAIMQSGTPGFGMNYRSLAEAEAVGMQLDAKAAAGGDVAKLRALSPVALLDLQQDVADPEAEGGRSTWLRITVDGKVLPDAPDRLIARHAPKPVIIGVDKVEFGPASDDIDLLALAETWFPGRGAEALAAYRAETAPDPRRGNLALRLQSDGEFHCPADRLADLMAESGWPVWFYEFDVGENGGLTRHAYEIGFIFGREPVGGGVQMQDYWAALAIAGDPNGKTAISGERPRWDRWRPDSPRQMEFGQSRSAMAPGKPRAAFCRFAEAY